MASEATEVPAEEQKAPFEKGIVKQVLSGDSLIVRAGPPKGGPPPERQISFTNVVAPRLARFNPSDQTYSEDEPYAWECREFLRKKLIGKEVQFRIEYRPPGSTPGGVAREYGYVHFRNSLGEMENITELLMKKGFIKTRNAANAKSDDQVELERLQNQAKEEAIGIWADEVEKKMHVREIDWEVEATFVERNKGKKMTAIIERVRDGSTMRAFILPTADDLKYKDISCMLTGIKCPRVPRDDSEPGEPFCLEARYFTESRLLQREIEILIEGKLNNENSRNKQLTLLGTIVHPMGNISELLLKEGFARCVDWSIVQLQEGTEKYRAADRAAKENKLRIWKDYTPSTSSVAIGDKEFTAKVVEVVNGDAIVVKDDAGTDKKIFFASFRPPRAQAAKDEPVENGLDPGRNAKRGRPLYDVPYMFEAREFLRKKLVGKKVNVVVDFIKPANDGYPERVCAKVTVGEVNVAEALISKGLGTAVKYGQDDDQRSSCYDALLAAELRAQKNNKGMHANKEWTGPKISDLSGDVTKSRNFLPFLKRAGRTAAIVEFVASGSRLRLYLPKETCLLTFLLGGISCPRARTVNKAVNQPITFNQTPEEDACGAKALDYSKTNCLQKEVEVLVDSQDKGGNFIGWLFVDKVNLSCALVEHGLAKVHVTADRSDYFDQLKAAEKSAKDKKIGVWKNYVEEVHVEQAPAMEETERKTAYKKVVVSEVISGMNFYAQALDSAQRLEESQAELAKELKENPPVVGALMQVKRGEVVAAQFVDDNWYRAKVERVEKNDRISLFYVDYGNREIVSCKKLATLPPHLKTMPPQAKEYTLACLKTPQEDDISDVTNTFSREALYKEFSLNVEYKTEGKEYVTMANPDAGLDLARTLLSQGVVLVEHRREQKLQSLLADYHTAQQEARQTRLGLWRYGDFTEDDCSEFGSKK